MTTVKPVSPMQTLNPRQTRTCHEIGVCLHPERACATYCALVPKVTRAHNSQTAQLASGVIDGPHHKSSTRTQRVWHGVQVVAIYVASAFVAIKLVLTLLEVAFS